MNDIGGGGGGGVKIDFPIRSSQVCEWVISIHSFPYL